MDSKWMKFLGELKEIADANENDVEPLETLTTQFEVGSGMRQSIEKGYISLLMSDDGSLSFRLTEEGIKYVESGFRE